MAVQVFLSRRAFLALVWLAAGGGLLAACGSSASSPASAASSGSPAKPAASASPAPASPSGQAADPSLKVVYPAVTGAQMPLWLAEELQFFDQQHVKVTSQFMESNISTKALIAKEVDVLLQAAASLITADLNGGADLVYVASAYNHAQFS